MGKHLIHEHGALEYGAREMVLDATHYFDIIVWTTGNVAFALARGHFGSAKGAQLKMMSLVSRPMDLRFRTVIGEEYSGLCRMRVRPEVTATYFPCQSKKTPLSIRVKLKGNVDQKKRKREDEDEDPFPIVKEQRVK
jgi:hypothetical protein